MRAHAVHRANFFSAQSVSVPSASAYASTAGNNTPVKHLISFDSPRRSESEHFIRSVFARHYDARVDSFAPDLMLLEQADRITAAAGWRGAAQGPLFLETYLDAPVEAHIARLAASPVARARIAEVGNLAAITPGGGARMILTLAEHLDRLGFEWVVFTATQELIGIFAKLGLPPLALGVADPARLGESARDWGRYYDSQPVVVAGRIRLALERMHNQPENACG
jgi:hypothetical protein